MGKRSSNDRAVRYLLDELLEGSRLYKHSQDYQDLLDFIVRLREFAPFNAMLLQLQKPGLTYAASAKDWRERFGRKAKEGARPLLILWPFSPVALVYDYMDTEGDPLPADVGAFPARGEIAASRIEDFRRRVEKARIDWRWVDAGDARAGAVRVLDRNAANDGPRYRILINRNHSPATHFSTLAHELGHFYLGHLGSDPKLKLPERKDLTHPEREIEAESVAYIVCHRNGVTPKSQTYLSNYVSDRTNAQVIDVYQVTVAANKVETLLGLDMRSRFARGQDVGDSGGAVGESEEQAELF